LLKFELFFGFTIMAVDQEWRRLTFPNLGALLVEEAAAAAATAAAAAAAAARFISARKDGAIAGENIDNCNFHGRWYVRTRRWSQATSSLQPK
jgi:hypothetical protein